MDISELELVQIIIILLVMTLVVVMIICLLSHYWLPALALISRFSHSQRDQATQTVLHSRLHSDLPPFMQQQQRRERQQQQLYRLQPTFPYLQQEIIDLPPVICLSDGEELLPYKGPCSLQLRDPEQQLELRRATVRAPPNRTVFDIDLVDIYAHRKSAPEPGGDDPGVKMEDPPPSYSEVMLDRSTLRADGRSEHDGSLTDVHTDSTDSYS
ncbi:protein TMEPAI-like [Solea solea]|uniref:protein TMEPAI-like n=1 Tax=Solea solea TaxID=90069 RepID=UPI00272A4E24|nr:protein TMEPAI-like [Solea solea]